ncbi:hypothetical protein [Limnobacter sp.]|jgi:hypothetical protein
MMLHDLVVNQSNGSKSGTFTSNETIQPSVLDVRRFDGLINGFSKISQGALPIRPVEAFARVGNDKLQQLRDNLKTVESHFNQRLVELKDTSRQGFSPLVNGRVESIDIQSVFHGLIIRKVASVEFAVLAEQGKKPGEAVERLYKK